MIAFALAALLAAEGLAAALKSVRQDGLLALAPQAQTELVPLLPKEGCVEASRVIAGAHGVRDRGDGPLIVARVETCHGERVVAVAQGSPPRVARLLDHAAEIRDVRGVSLTGGKGEDDLAVEVLASPTVSELRLFQRRPSGFAFVDTGSLSEFNALQGCHTGPEAAGGWKSMIKPEKAQLAVLRIDGACAGGAWQARCVTFRVEREALAKSGVCVLPRSLEPKALKAAGWR